MATAFVQAGILWSRFYSVSLGFALTNVFVLYLSFVRKRKTLAVLAAESHTNPDSVEMDALGGSQGVGVDVKDAYTSAPSDATSHSNPVKDSSALPGDARDPSVQQQSPPPPSTSAKDRAILTSKVNWLVACFLLLYVGAEVSLGGWCVAYLIDTRQGGVSVGYVASGFWGGIALSRVLLPRFNLWVGEKRVIFIYIALALGLEISIWVWRSMIANGERQSPTVRGNALSMENSSFHRSWNMAFLWRRSCRLLTCRIPARTFLPMWVCHSSSWST